MKNILLIATGGTIASVEGEDGLAPGLTDEGLLGYLPESKGSFRLHSINLMNVDSTNMQPEAWADIARAVYDHYDRYDGFVITHGTDTLGYTSAALSYMLQNLAKPVVLTGSMIPIGFEDTDATKNLKDALRFACEPVGGVFVVFDGKVIGGTRAVKVKSTTRSAFRSINAPDVARIDGEQVLYGDAIPPASAGLVKLDTSLCTEVFVLKIVPGMSPDIFDYLKKTCRGVVIEGFGNGGIPCDKRNLLPKIDELIEAGVAVVVTTQCLEEGIDLQRYEVGRKLSRKRIISAGDMTTEGVVTKLMWVLGRTVDPDQVKQMMETPIAGDG